MPLLQPRFFPRIPAFSRLARKKIIPGGAETTFDQGGIDRQT
jgi:hypothetical protein